MVFMYPVMPDTSSILVSGIEPEALDTAITHLYNFGKSAAQGFHRVASDNFRWAASKVHNLYEKRSQSAKYLLDNPKAGMRQVDSMTPIVEIPHAYSDLVVRGSPDLVSRTSELDIAESPQKQDRYLGFDLKESRLASPDGAAKPIAKEYVTIGDLQKYLNQFKFDLVSFEQSDMSLDSRIERIDFINYVSKVLKCDPLRIAPNFVKGEKYFTRRELVYLISQLFLHFQIDSPVDENHIGYPLESCRPEKEGREVVRKCLLKKQGFGPATQSQATNDDSHVKKSKLEIPPFKKKSKTASKTNDQGLGSKVQQNGSFVDEVSIFSSVHTNDGIGTRRAKLGIENCDGSGHITTKNLEKLKMKGVSLEEFNLPKAETVLLIRDLSKNRYSKLPNAPGAGHAIFTSSIDVSCFRRSTKSSQSAD
jgi:hypothetical protein